MNFALSRFGCVLRPTVYSLLAAVPLLGLACSSSSTPGATTEKDSGTSKPDTGGVTVPDAHVTTTPDATRDAVADTKATPVADAVAESGPSVADSGGPFDGGKTPPSSGTATASTARTNFAIHHLWLGDSLPDPSFTPDTTGTAWQKFGYNIDGLITNQYSTDVCTLAKGAASTLQVDGVLGVDNSFGENIVPFLASVLSNLSQSVSSAIAKGSFTVLVDTVGLTSSPTQTNTGLKGEILSGASYGSAPATSDAGSFLPTDSWPVGANSLSAGATLDGGALVAFPSAYVTNGLWVNGSPGDLTLLLVLQGQPLVLRIHEAIVTFHHSVDGAGQDHASGGIIAGVLRTSEFLDEINEVAAEQDYCAEASLLLDFIASTSDIMHDGTNAAGQACDGISVGLAFDADAIAAPSMVVPVVDAGGAPPPCVADAGH